MMIIRNRDGLPVSRSRNLAGIRRFVRGRIIAKIAIDHHGRRADAKLSILFADGHSFETKFASFTVLKGWVRRWRNVYGSPLIVNGMPAGTVNYHNEYLANPNPVSSN